MAIETRDFPVSTRDGRRLAARISGPADGPVVLYLGGTPGSLEIYEDQLREGERRGLRHLIYVRPGYFGSDRLPGRSVGDCVPDVVDLLDAVGADEVLVVGHSGGGPHAAACATRLPDRVRSGAVLSSFSPREGAGLDAWLGEVCEWNEEEFAALEEGDVKLEQFISQQARQMEEIKTAEQLRAVAGSLMSPADRKAMKDPRFLAFQLKCYPLAVKGGFDGWFDDNKAVFVEDWGFDLGENAVPVSIWHGDEDPVVPYVHGERFSQRMANATLRPLAGEGHISYFEQRYGDILEELIGLPQRAGV